MAWHEQRASRLKNFALIFKRSCSVLITAAAHSFSPIWTSSASASIAEKPEIRSSAASQEPSLRLVPSGIKPIKAHLYFIALAFPAALISRKMALCQIPVRTAFPSFLQDVDFSVQIQGSASPVPLDHRRGKHSKHQAAIFQCVRFQKAVIQTSCHPTRPRAGAPDCRLETPTSPTPRAVSLLGRSPGNAGRGRGRRQRLHRHGVPVCTGLQWIRRLDILQRNSAAAIIRGAAAELRRSTAIARTSHGVMRSRAIWCSIPMIPTSATSVAWLQTAISKLSIAEAQTALLSLVLTDLPPQQDRTALPKVHLNTSQSPR